MKKIITITLFIVLAATIPGCKKKLFDYRNKYLGDYQITYHFSYWQMDGVTKDTTILYKGRINYGNKGEIKIDWYDGNEYEFEVSKEGKISKCNSSLGSAGKHHFGFAFTDDLCGTGPLGANYTVSLSGVKE